MMLRLIPKEMHKIRLHSPTVEKNVSVLTFFRNVINEDGGTPGFDGLAFFTIRFLDKESCARCSALNVSFTEDVACKVH